MAEDRQSGPGFGGNSLILLAAAAASAVYMAWQKPPLVSSRPTDPDYRVEANRGEQDIDARLWQDPFAAVNRQLGEQQDKHKADGAHSIGSLQSELAERTLVLGVTLPGAPYPEDGEARRRLRYAVLAALHAANYAPRDEKHIGFFRTPATQQPPHEAAPPAVGVRLCVTITPPSGKGAPLEAAMIATTAAPPAGAADAVPAPLPPTIPFEWFESNDQKTADRHVVVVWLDEEVLATGAVPVASLGRLLHLLDPGGKAKFAVVGPQDSTTLKAMAKEIAQPSAAACRNGPLSPPLLPSPVLPIYNFGATADASIVLRLVGSDKRDLETHFAERLRYYRTSSSDRKLAGALVDELSRRGIDLESGVLRRSDDDARRVKSHRDHIALISEWDTVYGQYLPESMCQAFVEGASAPGNAASGRRPQKPVGDRASSAVCDGPSAFPPWISRFSYLRGLDGRLPNRRPAKETKPSEGEGGNQASGPQANATLETARQFESAEGQSQFDYLRRLAEHIRRRDEELRRSGEGRIAAIGVLGSDVYDKLLILQALRPDFPEALFFTTDLDALLVPQGKSRYTRNLVVASSFDLTLDDALQADIPPFRSTYQTSIFLATRLAVRNEWQDGPAGNSESDTRAALDRWLERPRLFQIGRSAPYALPSGPDDLRPDAGSIPLKEHAACADDFLKCPSVQPAVADLFPTFKSGSQFSIVLLIAAVLTAWLLSSHRLRRYSFWNGDESPAAVPCHARFVRAASLPLAALITAFGLCLGWPSIGRFLTQNGFGEPMSLIEGISLWPTVLLRIAGSALCVWLICYTLRSLDANLSGTADRMRVPRHHLHRESPNFSFRGRPLCDWIAEMMASFSWFSNDSRLARRPPGESGRPKVSISVFLGRYAASGTARVIRAAAGTLAMIVLYQILAGILGEPNTPGRGSAVRTIFFYVTLADVFATLFLIFLVADATMYTRSSMIQLTRVRTLWDDKTVEPFKDELGLGEANLDDWIDMQFLARRSRFITRLIYFPFLALALLILSRSTIFDDFTVPLTLIIVQAISLAVIIGSVFLLRRAAEQARNAACEHLNAKIITAKGIKKGGGELASQLEILLGRVENLRDGAFAPLSSQPFVKALLLPLLSYGATVLVHIYALPGF